MMRTGSRTIAGRTSSTPRRSINHKVNLFDMHHKYADVMHIDEVLDRLYTANGLRKAS